MAKCLTWEKDSFAAHLTQAAHFAFGSIEGTHSPS